MKKLDVKSLVAGLIIGTLGVTTVRMKRLETASRMEILL